MCNEAAMKSTEDNLHHHTLLILCRSKVTRKLAFEIYNTFISNLHNGPLKQETLFWDMKRICDCQGSVEGAPAEDSDDLWRTTWTWMMIFLDGFPLGPSCLPFTSFTLAGSSTSPCSKPEQREFFIPPQILKALKDETKEGALRMYLNGEITKAIGDDLRPYR
ncbi:uncharacterized protein Z519_00627 [Cladophialophora bantiana CBS 173.52]|uniref:Uncharacterized protein n=1 Tax=Cladophialophora bantiana (strain ATCC 10958 / CBS 173.52 / CDC B-1940 / NIH 8579) TaxID=1442370 RepID=A0A0D2IQF9_CLAB1|nr:uncharacterized protein Z519_00627 [Cladophialophora bantiana CBS 173.52]KIW98964.1 hypothetical protein Z519_00627 [Cladophialophora bantiana CBS 173.52]